MERTHTRAHPFSFTADSSLGSRPRRERRSSRQGQISQAQSARAYLIAAQAFLRPTPSSPLYKTALTGSEKESIRSTDNEKQKTTYEKTSHRTAPSCDGRSKGTRRKALRERSLSPRRKRRQDKSWAEAGFTARQRSERRPHPSRRVVFYWRCSSAPASARCHGRDQDDGGRPRSWPFGLTTFCRRRRRAVDGWASA